MRVLFVTPLTKEHESRKEGTEKEYTVFSLESNQAPKQAERAQASVNKRVH